MGLEQQAPFGELGEQQGPIARFDHLFEDLLESLQLGAAIAEAAVAAGEHGVGLFLESQGRVVADLLELGEQGQHLAVLLAQGGPGDGIEALFDCFVVELFLLWSQAHPLVELHLLRQVGDDRLVGFEPPQDEGPHPGLEIAHRGHVAVALDRQPVALAEEGLIAEHLGVEEVHQGPQLADPVFHRRARQGNPETAAPLAEPAGAGQVPGRLALLGAGIFDRLGFVDHHPLPVDAFEQFAVSLQQAVAGEHQIHALEGFLEGLGAGRPARAVVLLHPQLGGEAMGFPFPVGEHRGGRHQQHRALEFVFGLEVLQEGQQLDRFAQAHVVGQAGALVEAVQEGQPAQAPLLVWPQLAGEARWGRQGVGGLLLVVLLQHRLQPRASVEVVGGQPVEGVAFARGEPQGVVEAEARIGNAEFLGVLEIEGPQLDPGPLVLHQRAAFGLQALQVAQGQGDPADHEFPFPGERFAQGEAARFLRQLGLDRQAQPAGQAPGEAGGQHHAHAHIPQLVGAGAHQHKRLGRGELHRLRGGRIQAPLDRLKHGEGPAHALEQQLAGLGHGNLPHLQAPIARRPHGRGRHPQAGVGFGLEPEAQLPELLALGWGEQLQTGAGRLHLARHALTPVVGGDAEPLELLLVQIEAAIALAQGLLPGRQQGIEPACAGAEACPQLAIEQGFEQAGHPQATAAGAAAGQGGIAQGAGGQGAGCDLGQAAGQVFEAAAVVFPVEQGQPAGLALFELGQPAPPSYQAQGPALQVAPPAELIGHLRVLAGQGQLAEPFARVGRIQGPALHLPGPPLQLLGDWFTGLQGQAAPAAGIGAAPLGGLAAAGQAQGGAGRPQGLAPEAVVVEPGGQIVFVEGQGMLGGLQLRHRRRGHPPGVGPQK